MRPPVAAGHKLAAAQKAGQPDLKSLKDQIAAAKLYDQHAGVKKDLVRLNLDLAQLWLSKGEELKAASAYSYAASYQRRLEILSNRAAEPTLAAEYNDLAIYYAARCPVNDQLADFLSGTIKERIFLATQTNAKQDWAQAAVFLEAAIQVYGALGNEREVALHLNSLGRAYYHYSRRVGDPALWHQGLSCLRAANKLLGGSGSPSFILAHNFRLIVDALIRVASRIDSSTNLSLALANLEGLTKMLRDNGMDENISYIYDALHYHLTQKFSRHKANSSVNDLQGLLDHCLLVLRHFETIPDRGHEADFHELIGQIYGEIAARTADPLELQQRDEYQAKAIALRSPAPHPPTLI